ncbi:MAG TPA: hypothetical protein VLH85_01980 [Levilinea sp.]|nr:hypothetical protein [Levilinea sp.]
MKCNLSSGRPIYRQFVLLILFSLFFSACTPPPGAAQRETPVPEVTQVVQTPQPVDTPTPEPETDRLVLVMGQPRSQVEEQLRDLAHQNEMELEVLSEIQALDIQPHWKVIVLLPAPGNLGELTAAAPGVQFVTSSDADLPASPNLSVIHIRPEHAAFAAGYIGAVITPDWRIAGLLPADTAMGDRLGEAFRNGVNFYCGLCRSIYPPFVRWPLISMLPAGSEDSAWLAAVAELEPSIVHGMYLDERAGSIQLVEGLAAKNIILFGGETPPANILPRWAVTIRPELSSALAEIMPGVITGSGGQVVNAGLELVDINASLLSPGRQRLVEVMLDNLSAGYIEPFTIPLE